MAFSDAILTQCITRHLPYDPNELVFSRILTGRFNTSWFVTAPDAEYVLRIAPPQDTFCLFYERNMMKQEPGIHQVLLDTTSIPVPRILAFDESHELIESDYLIMERIYGDPLSQRPASKANVLSEIGNYLRQAHGRTSESYGYVGQHHPHPPQRSWIDAFYLMWHKLIDDVIASGHYSPEEGHHMKSLLATHIHLFDRPVKSSLLHMDVWAENILIDRHNSVAGLIDWDRAVWGDPEIEFAVLDYCGISEPAFWEGYGSARDNSAAAQTRTVFYLLYELQKYIPIRHFRQNSPAAARSYKAQVMHIANRALVF
ncbi:MAG: phosphotransferase [Chitinivibrionales bacterium]|nr:phosphotransferase [Chitinivibrionales bacterium]